MSGEDYCERCIHKNVCHIVAECLNSWQDDFSCNDFEPERPTGKWIKGTDEETGKIDIYPWTCSKCKGKYPWQPNYCPNCGAKMKGADND